jgi:hypothetical protein
VKVASKRTVRGRGELAASVDAMAATYSSAARTDMGIRVRRQDRIENLPARGVTSKRSAARPRQSHHHFALRGLTMGCVRATELVDESSSRVVVAAVGAEEAFEAMRELLDAVGVEWLVVLVV